MDKSFLELIGRIDIGLSKIQSGIGQLEDLRAENEKLQTALEGEGEHSRGLARKLNDCELEIESLTQEIKRLRARLEQSGQELERMRSERVGLINANERLRNAAMCDSVDAALLDQVALAEIDALKAERRLNLAEMDDIMKSLESIAASGKNG